MRKISSFCKLVIAIFIPITVYLNAAEKCPNTGYTNTQFINSTITLKILLVEFPDVRHRLVPTAYTKNDFEKLLVSYGSYVSPNNYSPDGDAVYGSMGDYFQKMSSGNLNITGNVINTVTGGIINWIVLPHNKSYYHSFRAQGSPIFNDALNAAINQGLSVSTTDYLAIIYAGTTYFFNSNLFPIGPGGLNPMASDKHYIMGERMPNQGDPEGTEMTNAKFSHIGIHCHEFAHTIGIKHSSGSRADLMEAGTRNGLENCGSAPAPLNPIARMMKGWLTPTNIIGQQSFNLQYSLIAPQIFIIGGDLTGEFILIENRRFDQNMNIGTTVVPDYNNSLWMPIANSQNSTNVVFKQGILVWRITSNFPYGEYEDNGLIYASGRYNRTYPENIATASDAGDIFPGVAGIKVLTPWSDYRNPYSVSYDPLFEYFNNVYVPCTKNSTNIGMEIISENIVEGYISVMLYQTNPQDAAPSKPQNLTVTKVYHSPKLTWSQMQEPDVLTGGHINIYRKTNSGSFNLLATVSGNSTSWIDNSLWGNGGQSVSYKIQSEDSQHKYSIFSDVVATNFSIFVEKKGNLSQYLINPLTYILNPNYPNPFNPTTMISFQIPNSENVVLKVYDLLGEEVATLVNDYLIAGYYEINFDANSLSSGMYVYRITAGKYSDTRKMAFIK